MTFELTILESEGFQVGELLDLAQSAKEYAYLARSRNTNKAYASDWKDFTFWCNSKRLISLPALPQSVVAYLISRARQEWMDYKGRMQKPLKVASLSRRLTAISQAHKLSKQPFDKNHPDIQEVWKGIRNSLGTAQTCKDPILIDDLRKMIEAIPIEKNAKPYLIGYRDKALLLLGFVGALRRSELVSLERADVKFAKEGLIVILRKSKTDQEREGRSIAIPYGSNFLTCPVRTIQEWLEVSHISDGALFRYIDKGGDLKDKALSSHAVALIIKRNSYVKKRREEANQNNSSPPDFSGPQPQGWFCNYSSDCWCS